MSVNLDDQIKIAQKDKLLAEIKKIESEKEQIDAVNKAAKKEAGTSWYVKGKFWQRFLSIFLGVSILGFYINFIIVPTSTINNLKLELENQKKEKRLYEKQNQLEVDSLKYEELIKITDSLRRNLDALSTTRQTLDSSMNEIIKTFEGGSNVPGDKIENTKNLLIHYKKQQKSVVDQDAIRKILEDARASKTISPERARTKFIEAYDLLPEALQNPNFKERVNRISNFETQVEFMDSFFIHLKY